ncbi:ABC-type nitrate/sulfonate/bicarbonate transport system, ATPase component [Seinonella peptonophila]|uniref:ABC-type nitrate/sulfonate/bicarbonate transport system, ATPase component n=1 Tax=Seinonella peptonophila TaxID=112248 RepID=A0A1M5ALL1_9BACL|nr:ABC transporter ATP-binding protein [Seinonella peptonophila]SHF30792.1 ABC-type nitrate/sulfonate/bicarbonate transport system, ATPase component [Seinonella peptonophila]
MDLEVSQLSFAYEHDRVIDQLSLSVHAGEFVSLIGPSGSGKSTLFYLLGGLYQPLEGEIQLGGQSIINQTGKIGYMPQQPSLFPWLTVAENIRLGRRLNRISSKFPDLVRLLKKARLDNVEHKYPHQLSGGMQQRVALLRTLAAGYPLLCLDEPFAALDALTRQQMRAWLFELLLTEHQTILFITHSVEEALLLSDRIYVLTNRPLQVKKEIVLPFQRDLSFQQRRDQSTFIDLRRKIESLLT